MNYSPKTAGTKEISFCVLGSGSIGAQDAPPPPRKRKRGEFWDVMGTSKIHPAGTPNARQFLEIVLETKWLYLLLNLFTASVPLIRSFEPRIAYYKSFGSLSKAMLIWSGFFLIWDIWYTDLGV